MKIFLSGPEWFSTLPHRLAQGGADAAEVIAESQIFYNTSGAGKKRQKIFN
jgi:hypothetical protein